MNNNLIKIQELCNEIESYIQEEMELAEYDENDDYLDVLAELLVSINRVETFDPEVEV